MNVTFKFRPISFSWVAIHPQPKGIIQFIGGAFFGTFPTLFYRYFLGKLFEEGYTIVAFPFRFSFRHWSIAISLLEEQSVLRQKLIETAKHLGYQADVYQEKTNYFWVGHSLGCKYITLLEVLGDLKVIEECVKDSEEQYQQIADRIRSIGNSITNIKGQPSLLIAPDISDTESAIPIRFLANFIDKIGLGVLPTRKQTKCFIEFSELFKLTALISFDEDKIAGSEADNYKDESRQENSDVLFLIEQLELRYLELRYENSLIHCPVLRQELKGKHLEPLGIKIGNYIVDLNPFDKFIEPIAQRKLEHFAASFLLELNQRRLLLEQRQ